DTIEKIQEEPAITGGDLFLQFTGAKPPQNGVVVPEIARLTSLAVTVEPEAVPGLLGKTLAQNGKRLALFGNADIPGELHREAALMVMTPTGRIPLGSVGQDLLLNDSKAPFGWRTDYAKLFTKMKAVWDKADVVLIETGDTSRIESAQEMLTPERISLLRRQAIREADPFIGRVLKELHPDTVMLFGVSPNKQMLKDGNNGLEPILLYGKGRGYLSSASTRRAGYVTNMDLYSTICDLVGVKPVDSGKGFIMSVDSSKTDLNALIQEEVFFKNLRNARYPINDGLTILFLIGVLGGIIGIWQGYSQPTAQRYLTCVIAVLLLPVGVLLGGLAGYDPVWPMIGVTLGSSLFGALILTRIFSFRWALVFTLFIVPLLLLSDVFCGGQWMLRSAQATKTTKIITPTKISPNFFKETFISIRTRMATTVAIMAAIIPPTLAPNIGRPIPATESSKRILPHQRALDFKAGNSWINRPMHFLIPVRLTPAVPSFYSSMRGAKVSSGLSRTSWESWEEQS
ncbi:MAG TPA: hypothetical protein VHR47_12935, partial [Bacillota bacterium]|nr:hypothetical protein [Bacillota bacterium]